MRVILTCYISKMPFKMSTCRSNIIPILGIKCIIHMRIKNLANDDQIQILPFLINSCWWSLTTRLNTEIKTVLRKKRIREFEWNEQSLGSEIQLIIVFWSIFFVFRFTIGLGWNQARPTVLYTLCVYVSKSRRMLKMFSVFLIHSDIIALVIISFCYNIFHLISLACVFLHLSNVWLCAGGGFYKIYLDNCIQCIVHGHGRRMKATATEKCSAKNAIVPITLVAIVIIS